MDEVMSFASQSVYAVLLLLLLKKNYVAFSLCNILLLCETTHFNQPMV